MGKFSVQNLFDGVRNAVEQVITFQLKALELVYIKLPQQVFKVIYDGLKDPVIRPIIQILSLATNIYNVFGKQISDISKYIEQIPRVFTENARKMFEEIFKNKRKEAADILIPWKRDARKALELVYQAPDAIKVIKNPKRLLDYIRKPLDAYFMYLIKSAPKGNAASGFIEMGLKTGDKVLSKYPPYAVAKKAGPQIVSVATAVIKNAPEVTKAVKTAPKFFESITPLLKLGGKSLKTVGKAIPIVGEFMQAVDQQYLENEIKEIRKQVDKLRNDADVEKGEVIRERQKTQNMATRIAELHRLLVTGKTPSGASTQIDYARIAQIVKSNTIQPNSPAAKVDTNAIATAVVAKMPKTATQTPIDYNRISGLMTSAVVPLKNQNTQTNLLPLTGLINQLIVKTPTSDQVAAKVTAQIKPLIEKPQAVDLTPIKNPLADLAASLGQIKTNVTAANLGINTANVKLDGIKTRVDETATKKDLTQTQAALGANTNTQAAATNANVNTQHQLTREEIDKIRRNFTIPTSVIEAISTQSATKTTNNLTPYLNNAISQSRVSAQNSLNAATSSNAALNAAVKASENAKETYNLVGGDALKNGLPVAQEQNVLQAGMNAFGGATGVVQTLPALMAAMTAVSHFRGGLHRMPASLPGSLVNPSTPAVNITDKLGHDQHLWKLTDEKIGAPTPIKTKMLDGSFSTSQSRNVHESLDTIQAQTTAVDQEIEILQQTVIKLVSETLKINMIVLQDHAILETMRDFMGYRYTETKEKVPTEISLGKDGLASWLEQNTLHYVGSKLDQKFDLTQMMQKLYLETGKVSSSFFEKFDPADANAKVPGEKFSKATTKQNDDDWTQFVKFATQTPEAVRKDTDPKAKITRYTNNDTVTIQTDGVQMPQG